MSFCAAILVTPFIYLSSDLLHCALVCAIKWLVVGRYQPGKYPYYGVMHYKWVMMMTIRYSMLHILQSLQGTVFTNLYYKAMGAQVGLNACIMAIGINETDLISIENQVSIGRGQVLAAHTIENMVIKMEHTKYLLGSTVRNMAFIFPGCTMERFSTLLEYSHILKGETIPEGECWSGIPAGPVDSEGGNTTSSVCIDTKKDQGAFLKKLY